MVIYYGSSSGGSGSVVSGGVGVDITLSLLVHPAIMINCGGEW